MIHQTHQPTFGPDHYPDYALRWTNRIRRRNLGNSLGSDVSSRGSDIGYASSPLQVNPVVCEISYVLTGLLDTNSRSTCVQRVMVMTRSITHICKSYLTESFQNSENPHDLLRSCQHTGDRGSPPLKRGYDVSSLQRFTDIEECCTSLSLTQGFAERNQMKKGSRKLPTLPS